MAISVGFHSVGRPSCDQHERDRAAVSSSPVTVAATVGGGESTPNHFSARSASRTRPRVRSHRGVSGSMNSDKQPAELITNITADTALQCKNMANMHSVNMPTPTNTVTTEKYSCRYLVGHTSDKYRYAHTLEPSGNGDEKMDQTTTNNSAGGGGRL